MGITLSQNVVKALSTIVVITFAAVVILNPSAYAAEWGGGGGGEREERLKFPFVLVNSTINFCSQHFLSRKRMTREKKQATFSDENIFLLLSLLSQQKIIF